MSIQLVAFFDSFFFACVYLRHRVSQFGDFSYCGNIADNGDTPNIYICLDFFSTRVFSHILYIAILCVPFS